MEKIANTKSSFKYQQITTFLEVEPNIVLAFVFSITQTTDKLLVIWVYWLMTFQLCGCVETRWTFTAKIRLHVFIRSKCALRWCGTTYFFSQRWHVNQVPSLCDPSRCKLSFSWIRVRKWLEQCLHEYSFVSVWRTRWYVSFGTFL